MVGRAETTSRTRIPRHAPPATRRSARETSGSSTAKAFVESRATTPAGGTAIGRAGAGRPAIRRSSRRAASRPSRSNPISTLLSEGLIFSQSSSVLPTVTIAASPGIRKPCRRQALARYRPGTSSTARIPTGGFHVRIHPARSRVNRRQARPSGKSVQATR